MLEHCSNDSPHKYEAHDKPLLECLEDSTLLAPKAEDNSIPGNQAMTIMEAMNRPGTHFCDVRLSLFLCFG